ncbi:hypothetical protein MDT46_004163 [Vibrio vulnificus]|nr:hypothetical protein [Vibrio vulnificus]
MISLLIVMIGGYGILWAVPGGIFLIMVSYGDLKHIIALDKHYSNNLDKLYDKHGYLVNQLSTAIGCRYMWYLIAYPVIRSRTKAKSIKLSIFMWFNSLGMWSWFIVSLLILWDKWLSVTP